MISLLSRALACDCNVFSLASDWPVKFIVNSPSSKTFIGIVVHGVTVLIRQNLQRHGYLQTVHIHSEHQHKQLQILKHFIFIKQHWWQKTNNVMLLRCLATVAAAAAATQWSFIMVISIKEVSVSVCLFASLYVTSVSRITYKCYKCILWNFVR